MLLVERCWHIFLARLTKITSLSCNLIVSLIELRGEYLFITTGGAMYRTSIDASHVIWWRMIKSVVRTWLKIKRGRRSSAFNENRSRIAGSKIIHIDEVPPAMLFARSYRWYMSYAYVHAFARKFQLNFICGVAIESPPNRSPAINPHFRVSFGLVYKWRSVHPTG